MTCSGSVLKTKVWMGDQFVLTCPGIQSREQMGEVNSQMIAMKSRNPEYRHQFTPAERRHMNILKGISLLILFFHCLNLQAWFSLTLKFLHCQRRGWVWLWQIQDGKHKKQIQKVMSCWSHCQWDTERSFYTSGSCYLLSEISKGFGICLASAASILMLEPCSAGTMDLAPGMQKLKEP